MASAPRKKSSTSNKRPVAAAKKKSAASTRKKATTTSTHKPAATRAQTSADRADKSVEAFREALERSVTLSRERIQEVVDDSVKRGRMTRDDANEMVSKLLARGRKQTEDLMQELEKLLENAQGEVKGRAKAARKGATKARVRATKAADRVAKTALDAADEPLAQADKLRRRAGVGSGFPIIAYDDLRVAQVRSRLADLGRPELRKVRTYETNNKARKGILNDIEGRLS